MLKRIQIVIISILTLFLITHQSFGTVLHEVTTETKTCCKSISKEKACCKKVKTCRNEQCCNFTFNASVAILQSTDYSPLIKSQITEKEVNTTIISFLAMPHFSVWQPPKISLNL